MIVWLKMTKIEKKQNEELFPQNKEKEMTQKGEKWNWKDKLGMS